MIVKNTTTQNKTKQDRLNTEHIIPTHCISGDGVSDFLKSLLNYKAPKEVILYSIGCKLLGDSKNTNVLKFLSEYDYECIHIEDIPIGEFDLLGSAYQYLNSKLENLERGSFYTGYNTAYDFINDLVFDNNQTILDPSCGSGTFLFSSSAESHQIFGVDNDSIAVMIAKFNYFIKFPYAEYPNIFCDDFFVWYSKNKQLKFDYIIGNPPYGATLDLSNIQSSYIKSGESFSYFIEYGCSLLIKNGILRYLLPESILNVKKHSDIRRYILNNTNLTHIKRYNSRFSGVMSELYMLEINLESPNEYVLFTKDNISSKIPKQLFTKLKNNVFVHLTQQDISIINKVEQRKGYDLSNSIFALGVVTGNNSETLLDNPTYNSEPIYTGKEVCKYKLLPPVKHIIFDRNLLQQVAPDRVYRASKKLVYKTINKHIKIAIDETGSLTTNSANIIIPTIIGLDIYTIMGILNSQLYSYLNIKLFGGVNKIAKENLQALPLPLLSFEDNNFIKQLVIQTMETGDDKSLQDYINKKVFGLTKKEIVYINQY